MAKLNEIFLNNLILLVCNNVYICKHAIPVTAAVVEAIAGIIFPATSFAFKKLDGSIE